VDAAAVAVDVIAVDAAVVAAAADTSAGSALLKKQEGTKF
jgi:hypothetical protein